MTAITGRTCEAWWILEAADLRNLPAPFVVSVHVDQIQLGLSTVEDFDRWVEAIDAEPVTLDGGPGRMVQHTASGELLDFPVSVFVCEPVEVASVVDGRRLGLAGGAA